MSTPDDSRAVPGSQPAVVAESLMSPVGEEAALTEELPGAVWAPVRVVQGAGGLLLVGLALLVTVSVLMRAVGAGFVGTVEFGAMAMVLLVALGAPAVAAADENFRLEIVDMFAPPQVVRALDKVALVFQLLVSAVVTWFALSLFLDDLRTGTTMAGELGIQRAWLTGIVAVGLALTAYAVAVRFVRALRAPGPEEG